MKIIKTKNYEKDFKKKIKSKHKKLEMEIISSIENLILDSSDFKSLLLNPLSRIYNIKQKEGNLITCLTPYRVYTVLPRLNMNKMKIKFFQSSREIYK